MATTAVATVQPQQPDRADRRRRSGRPTLLAPGVRALLLDAIRAGNRPSVAARLAGLSPKTLDEWLRRGRGEDIRRATPAYARLVDDVALAQAQAEARAMQILWEAMPRSPRWAAWYLEAVSADWRRHRLPPEPEAAVQVTAPHPSEILIVDPDLLRRLAREALHPTDVPLNGAPRPTAGPIHHPLVTDSKAE